MASLHSLKMLDLLQVWLPSFLIERLSRQTDFVQRDATIDPVFMVWTLVLGWTASATRSLAGLHRAYQRHLGCDCDRSTFYKRLNPALLDLFDALWPEVLAMHAPHQLGAFKDIVAMDSTILALYQGLLGDYPSCQKHQAACKLHVVMSLSKASPNRIMLDAGKADEHKGWRLIGPWVAGHLFLMDLGYYNFWCFHRLARAGATFLTRVKTNCALQIVQDVSPGAGRRAQVIGKTVSQALKGMTRKEVEFVVEVPVQLKSGRSQVYSWRVLAQRNDKTGEYHTYMTNAAREVIGVKDVGELYALRWQIELLFKGLKSVGRLHHLPSRKPEIIKLLIKAALLFVVLSGWLRRMLFDQEQRLVEGFLRTLIVLREHCEYVLGELAKTRPGYQEQSDLERFRKQCRDPNLVRERAFCIAPIVDYSQSHAL
jgi:putative transposase